MLFNFENMDGLPLLQLLVNHSEPDEFNENLGLLWEK